MPNDNSCAFTRTAKFRTSSYNKDTNTVLVVLSTGASVTRTDWNGPFEEVLSLEQEWPNEIPLLDSHRNGTLFARLGNVTDIAIEEGKLVGKATLSKHNEAARLVALELADGQSFGVSIGYRVNEWEEAEINGKRTKTATQIELLEASLTTVPADNGAGTRSNKLESNTKLNTRSDINQEIRSIAKTTGLDQSWIDKQIDSETDLNNIRLDALKEMESRAATVITTHNSLSIDNPTVRKKAKTEAVFTRYNPTHTPSDKAREFIGMSTVDLARDALATAGHSTTGLHANSVVERALQSTSEFPEILGNSMGRTLRVAYETAPSGLKQTGKKTTAKDFKDKYRLTLSAAPELKKISENGEFEHGALSEEGEAYKLASYGRIVGLTRQSIVNDDLGAFADLARRMGQAAASTEAQLLVDILEDGQGLGPVMSDGNRLFHVNNNNIGTADNLSLIGLSTARTALHRQVGLANEAITITPKYLIVPPELQTTAEQLMAQIVATKASEANVFSGTMQVIVEPRLKDKKRWYISADPSQIDGLEYAYLEGQEGVQIETRAGFEVDGIQLRARTDFGAGFVESRGWHTNAGK